MDDRKQAMETFHTITVGSRTATFPASVWSDWSHRATISATFDAMVADQLSKMKGQPNG